MTTYPHLSELQPGVRVEYRCGPEVVPGVAESGIQHASEMTYRTPEGWVTVPHESDHVRIKADDGRTLVATAATVVVV